MGHPRLNNLKCFTLTPYAGIGELMKRVENYIKLDDCFVRKWSIEDKKAEVGQREKGRV